MKGYRVHSMFTVKTRLGVVSLVAMYLAVSGSAYAGPKNGEEWLEAAKQFAMQKDIKKAVRAYKKASRYTITRDAAIVGLAKFLVDNGDLESSIMVMSRYLKNDNPFSIEGHLMYADLLLTRGEYDSVKKEIEIIKVLRPTWAPGKEIVGLMAFSDRHTDDAIANLSYFLKENPTSYRARLARGKTFLMVNKTQEAVADFKILSEQFPEDISVRELLGDSLYNNHSYSQAEEVFQNLIGMNPENGLYHAKLARSQEAQKKFEKCLISYERAIQFTPNDIDTAYHYTEILLQEKRVNAAEKEWKREVALDIGFEPAIKQLVKYWSELRKWDEVATLLSKFTAKYPERTWAVTQYTKLLISIDQLDRAQDIVAKHREVTVNIAEAYVLEAMVLRARGLKVKALELLTRADLRLPGVPSIKYNAALVAEEIGDSEKAIELYRQVSGDSKLAFQAKVNLALMFEKMGNYSESVTVLRGVDAPADQKVAIQKKINELQGYGAGVGGLQMAPMRVPASE